MDGEETPHDPGMALQISGAMILFALPRAHACGGFATWLEAWRAGGDASAFSAPGAKRKMKALCFCELGLGALRGGMSLLAGTTAAIEWDDTGHASSS